MSPEDAEEYTQALGQALGGGWRQVEWGQRMGVPQALGLSTADWVKGRLGGYVRQAVPERRAAVAELTAPVDEGGSGLSTRQAAEVLGVDHATIARDASVANATDEDKTSGVARDASVANATNDTPHSENGAPPATADDPYPFMQAWKPYHVAEAGEALEKIPEAERPKAAAMLEAWRLPAKDAIEITRNLADLPPVERERVFALASSDDSRERSLALTEAAKRPPMPDPRVALLRDARTAVSKAARLFSDDPHSADLAAILPRIDAAIAALRGKVT